MLAARFCIALAVALLASGVPVSASLTASASGIRSGDAPVLFDEDGYRTARYRAPITVDPAPAQRIALADALALEPERDALFIDVMPAEGGVRDSADGTWHLAQPHRTIAGAHWHPEAGRIPAEGHLWQALEQAARQAAPHRPVILFCRVDCWMSWNAARRLAMGGLANIWWLAEGIDGWHEAGRELVAATPVAVPASANTPEK